MNPIDQAIIREDVLKFLEQSGRVGRVTKTVLTHITSENDTILAGNFVKVSDEYLDLTKVKKFSFETVEEVIELTEFTVETISEGSATITKLLVDGDTIAVSIKQSNAGIEKGTYALGDVYSIRIEFAETIHPIDPKFLPPVDSITMNGADGKQYKLTVSGGALNISEVV